MKLSQDDEMFIVNKILKYHPEKEKKMAGQGNYIMVSTKQLIFAWEWNHREMLSCLTVFLLAGR